MRTGLDLILMVPALLLLLPKAPGLAGFPSPVRAELYFASSSAIRFFRNSLFGMKESAFL